MQGAENVRTVMLAARDRYQHQEISFAGDYGDDGFLELYQHFISSDFEKGPSS